MVFMAFVVTYTANDAVLYTLRFKTNEIEDFSDMVAALSALGVLELFELN